MTKDDASSKAPPTDKLARRRLVLNLAAEADCDPRSIEKRLRGELVRGIAGDRIDKVLAARGLLPEAAAPNRR